MARRRRKPAGGSDYFEPLSLNALTPPGFGGVYFPTAEGKGFLSCSRCRRPHPIVSVQGRPAPASEDPSQGELERFSKTTRLSFRRRAVHYADGLCGPGPGPADSNQMFVQTAAGIELPRLHNGCT